MNDHQEKFRTLETLDDWELVDEDQDIRGWPLITASGERLGTISHLLVDRSRERVAAVRLGDGRTYPAEPLKVQGRSVVLGGDAKEMSARGEGAEEERIPIVEERLVVGKREVETGGIRVRSRVLEKPATEQVQLRDEHVEIERRPVDERVDNTEGMFKDRTVEMTETDEEAVVAKDAVVREELVVRKTAEDHVERVSDTVRHTEVDVEEFGSDRASDRR